MALLVIEQQPCRRHAKDPDAGGYQLVEQVDDVVVVDHGDGQPHEHVCNRVFTRLGSYPAGPHGLRVGHWPSSEKRTRRATTSVARSGRGRASANARARSSKNACSIVTPAWAITIPVAWCTCNWNDAPET